MFVLWELGRRPCDALLKGARKNFPFALCRFTANKLTKGRLIEKKNAYKMYEEAHTCIGVTQNMKSQRKDQMVDSFVKSSLVQSCLLTYSKFDLKISVVPITEVWPIKGGQLFKPRLNKADARL